MFPQFKKGFISLQKKKNAPSVQKSFYFAVKKMFLREAKMLLRRQKCSFQYKLFNKKTQTTFRYSKPHKHTYSSFICSQTPPPGISGQIRTTADTIRLQQTPNDTNRLPQKPKKAVQGCAAVCVDMEWRLLVSVSVLCCLEM